MLNVFLVIDRATERDQARKKPNTKPFKAVGPPEKIPQSSMVDNSNTLKWDKSLENSDHPVTSRQLY